MTGNRAKAYRRVVMTVRDMGPAKLRPSGEACVRVAADCFDVDAEAARRGSRRPPR